MKDQFIQAIHDRRKIRVTFFSKEDGTTLCRKCAPMDYGPKRKAKNQSDRFHYWDYESDEKNHTLGLLPNQIQSIVVLDEEFNPAEFITWDTKQSPWHVPRDWGEFS
jgi:hypothetical protein